MARKVAIVGFADSYALAPFEDPSVEIWGINELHRYLPRWDRWFELHSRESFEIKGNRDQEAHVNWLRAQPAGGKPIFMRELFEDIPAGIRYPLEAMSERLYGQFGRTAYFTSSIGYMLAMAISEGRDETFRPTGDDHVSWIGLYGIDLASDTEYSEQRPNAEYLIGLAQGLGIEVVIAEGAALLKADHLYGFENRDVKEGTINYVFLTTRIAELTDKRNKVLDTLHTLDGALEEATYHQKLLDYARRGLQPTKKVA
jgi:hypothetical protein